MNTKVWKVSDNGSFTDEEREHLKEAAEIFPAAILNHEGLVTPVR